MANISQCGTGCLARQNKPFRPAKQPVLQRKNDAATNRLAIKQLAATPLKVSNTRKNITPHGARLTPSQLQSTLKSRSSSLPTSGFFSSMLFITEAISPLTASPSTPRALSMAATSAAASLGRPSSVMVCW